MTYSVYHVDNLRDAPFKGSKFPADFTHVADVDTDDLGRVFQLTNTIDDPWVDNDGVKVTEIVKVAGGARSTSVGDVIVDPSGRQFLVAGVGHKEFTGSDAPAGY